MLHGALPNAREVKPDSDSKSAVRIQNNTMKMVCFADSALARPMNMGCGATGCCGSLPRSIALNLLASDTAMPLSFRTSARILALMCVFLAGCASSETQYARNMEQLGFSTAENSGQELFRRIGAEPTNARLHFENGLYMLARGRYGDLEIARVAFANASRLAADWWAPALARAITEYRLGQYRAALSAYAEAVERRGRCGQLCYGLALIAFRNGYFGLAERALSVATRAGPAEKPADRQIAEFLAAALADGPEAQPAAPLRERLQATARAWTAPKDPNAAIDAYVIRQNRSSSSSQGINLLEALQLQFGATLVNLEHVRETGQSAVTQRQHSLEVSIPTVTYALNIASEDENSFSIEASPSVIATPGKTSRFFGGANVLIVPQGENSEPVERDIGMNLQVTPSEITDDYVDLEAMMELTHLTGNAIGGTGAQILQTEKTLAEATARIPLGRAIALGSGATVTSRLGEQGVPGIRELPGAGGLFGTESASATRSDLLVLIAVRQPPEAAAPEDIDEDALSRRLFGAAVGSVARVSRLPSQVPTVGMLEWLAETIP